jgi:hypothetical protein
MSPPDLPLPRESGRSKPPFSAATVAARRVAHALQQHMVSLPQISQLLQHHLLRGVYATADACRAAADLVLPEPRHQQGGLVV